MAEDPKDETTDPKPAADAPDAPKAEAPVEEPGEASAEAAGSADDEDDDAPASEKGASPDAILKRVNAFGEEDEADRLAREEEEKLAARRKASKKGKKGGLEVSAKKRLERIGEKNKDKKARAAAEERRTAPARAAEDPLISKGQELSAWARKNQKTVTYGGLAVLVVLLGIIGLQYRDNKREVDASVELTKAVADERGRIMTKAEEDDKDKEDKGPKDPRPAFKSEAERRESALKRYREVQSRFPKTGAALLARLAEGSILLDKNDPDGAAAAFTEVRTSPLAKADVEVRGRSIEGLGFAHELKAFLKPDEKDKALDAALAVYKELETEVDVKGFKELSIYHQGRVLEAKGDADGAKKSYKTVRERVTKPGENHPFPYLEEAATDRLRALDPMAVPPKSGGQMSGGKMNEAQMRKLLEQLQKSGGMPPGGGGMPGMPPGMPPGLPPPGGGHP